MVLVKNLNIFYLTILGKTGQNNTFRDILEGKNVYLGNKTRSWKNPKIRIFPKGIVHGFWQKIGNFFVFFFLGKISPENASNDILQRKNAFLDYKNKNLIKSKNKHSFNGVGPCFWSKIWNFASLYLWENSQGKCVSRHFRKEERLFRLQKQKVNKDEKLGFFRRG